MPSKQILVVLVNNKPGVLNRVASLFRRRGFNIESIAVGLSEQPDISRMTIVVDGSTGKLEQVRKQLDKLIDVIKILDLGADNAVVRELALIKVKATAETRGNIIQIVDIFRAGIVDVSSDSLIVEVTGDKDKVDSLYNLLRPFGIKEVARTGYLAMSRGNLISAQEK
jgi:acetolactate synthase-1/3 small subunit